MVYLIFRNPASPEAERSKRKILDIQNGGKVADMEITCVPGQATSVEWTLDGYASDAH